MKKLLLASAIAALSVSAANAAPTIYGKAFVSMDYVNAEIDGPLINEDESTVEINSYSSRIGFKGISKLLNTIKIIKSKLNTRLEIEGFLLTMFDSRLRLANQIYEEVKRHFQELVFKTVIQRNVKLGEAPSHGVPCILYDATSTGARNYISLAKEIVAREN